MSRVSEILNFWFGSPDAADHGKQRAFWFTKKQQFDQEVRTLFLADYQQAVAGELDSWQETANSCLALILLLDQFPRNMFRGTAQAFAADAQALSAAQYAVANKFDQELLVVQRQFVYLPFEHSENLEHQHQAVKLFSALKNDPDTAISLDYAIRHCLVIERFGRFPHRNAILGRVTTPEEAEFLQQQGSAF